MSFEVDPEMRDYRGKLRSDFQTSFEGEESLTVQSDAPLADIQQILRGHGILGIDQMLDTAEVQYADVSEFTDYSDMMRNVKQAEEAFMQLPSKVRGEFNHDVYEWLDRAHDERRAEPAREENGREGDVTPTPLVEPVAAEEAAGGV